jgi:hypothetical protein
LKKNESISKIKIKECSKKKSNENDENNIEKKTIAI